MARSRRSSPRSVTAGLVVHLFDKWLYYGLVDLDKPDPRYAGKAVSLARRRCSGSCGA
jgi:hypothetical protein